MIKFDSILEEHFYNNILVNYEILSMIKGVQTQHWIEDKRYDFVLLINENTILLIEVDSKQFHSTLKQRTNDLYKDYLARNYNIELLRFLSVEIFSDPEKVANKIEGMVELLKS